MSEHEYDQFKQDKKDRLAEPRSWPITIVASIIFALSLFVGYESCKILFDNTWLALTGVVFSIVLGALSLTVVMFGTVKTAIDNLALFLISIFILP